MPKPLRLAAALALLLLPAAGSANPDTPAPERSRAMAALSAPLRPAPPQQDQGPRWGAVYAPLLGSAYGLAMSGAGSAEARQAAEARCRRMGGEGCRLLAEFAGQRCGAVAQAVHRDVLAALRPLNPSAIRATTAGGGETGAAAGHAALASCQRQGRGVCVVVATACAER